MYSSFVRLQNVFGFFTTIVTILGSLIAATDLLHARTPSATVRPAGLQVVRGRPHYYSKKNEEYAVVRFHLDADLSSLFTWNTKEVFVYVTAEWEGANSSDTNTAVIWDSIITSPSSDYLANIGPVAMRKLRKSAAGKSIDPSRGIIHLKNQKPKYQITHPSGKIAETEKVRLRLHYNVQPWVGMLSWNQEASDADSSSSSDGIWAWVPRHGTVQSPLWASIDGGKSESFALPAIVGKKKTTTNSS
ncbi:microsomal signal peptidase subunit [Grosmannia clavigera kw1407]|uniref:Signal peptidase complex subunit 3 n=1 Tax=Grosmannia clavigera (strain kw1407 / UAMH 11150) TaxID=655863 RepID=F0XG73_GROCL|nr:microsomal signal peptidase subunit [Grosmannia clavigera kw1407]EFX02883.1 microsomal signal peptidase subunit [Grosmannia clavigera kw1407]